ncbi:MAG: conjugal transfer protein TrbF [Pseudomonadota bacterium]
MIFKRAVQRYGQTPEPETPYQRAGQLWDERIGSARVQARNWRLMAFGSLLLAGGLGGGVLWQSVQSRVVPYVVEVDRLGEARAVTEAEAAFRPTDAQVAWHLSRFIRNVRGVSLDPVVMRQDWLDAYAFTTQRGSQFLGDYARAANPFAHVGERTVSVQVVSVVRASDKSFQLKWSETVFERGSFAGRSNWTAILTIVTRAPANADVLRKNPLGIYVDAVDWSRELEVPATPTPAAVTQPPVNIPSGSPLDPNLNQTAPVSQEIPQ